ncbi:hypothetical protein TGGT1_409080, partial [Toxoplasma gondii GT1]
MPAAKAMVPAMKALPGQALPKKKGLPPVKAGEAGKAAADTSEGPRAVEEPEPDSAAAKAGEADAKALGPKLAMPAAKAMVPAMKALPGQALPKKKGLPPVKAGEAGKAAADTSEGPRAVEEPEPDSAAAKAGEADAKALGPKLAMPAAKAMVPAMKALPGQALPKKKGLPPVKAGEAGKAAADTSEGPRAVEEPEPDSAAAKAGEADAKTLGPKLAMAASKATLQAPKCLSHPVVAKKAIAPVNAGGVGKPAADVKGEPGDGQPEEGRVLEEGGETEAKDAGPKVARPFAKTTLPAPRCLSHPVVAKKAIAPVKAGEAGMPAADVKGEPGDGQPEEGRVLEEGGETEAKDAGPKVARPFAKTTLPAPRCLSHPVVAKKAIAPVKAGGVGKPAADVKGEPGDGQPEEGRVLEEGGETEAKDAGPKVARPFAKTTLPAPKCLSHPVVAKKAIAPVNAGGVGKPAADVKGEPGDGQPEEGRVLEEGGETEAKDAGPKVARPFAKTTLPAPKCLSHPVVAKKAIAPVNAGGVGKPAADVKGEPGDGQPEEGR